MVDVSLSDDLFTGRTACIASEKCENSMGTSRPIVGQYSNFPDG